MRVQMAMRSRRSSWSRGWLCMLHSKCWMHCLKPSSAKNYQLGLSHSLRWGTTWRWNFSWGIPRHPTSHRRQDGTKSRTVERNKRWNKQQSHWWKIRTKNKNTEQKAIGMKVKSMVQSRKWFERSSSKIWRKRQSQEGCYPCIHTGKDLVIY